MFFFCACRLMRPLSKFETRSDSSSLKVYSTDQDIKGETHFTSQQKLALNTRAI